MRLVVGIVQIAIAVWLIIQNIQGFAAIMRRAPLDQWNLQIWVNMTIPIAIPLIMILGGWYLIRDFGLLAEKFSKPTQHGDPR